MKNQVQLIAYADRASGGSLKDLDALLSGPLAGVFGAVHILPFFHPIDGTDAGFDPIDHTLVDPRLGDWSDIRALARKIDVMADVIVNHISSQSPQFEDYVANGDASPYSGMFLTPDKVFPEGATEADWRHVYRPRPGLPFTDFALADGSQRTLWTTFTPQQVDIDVRHPQGRIYLDAILRMLASSGVSMIRLDAVGYAIKKAGQSC
ncbi:MAG: sucrose phosphorylase, partial [Burkholderiales bacterium]|nr:sucrose phosphorylase [Burkholderiales bacterium]